MFDDGEELLPVGATVGPAPVPTEDDLADGVHRWINTWIAQYCLDRYGRDERVVRGAPEGFSVPLCDVPDGLKSSGGWRFCMSWLKKQLLRDAKGLKGVGLSGPTGTGKTTLMAALWHDMAAVCDGTPPMFIESRALVRFLKAQDQPVWERNSRMADTANAQFLAIDDLGAESSHEWDQSLIVELLETRHAKQLTTCFTSNLNQQELDDRYGLRCADRLKSTTSIITMKGKSKR